MPLSHVDAFFLQSCRPQRTRNFAFAVDFSGPRPQLAEVVQLARRRWGGVGRLKLVPSKPPRSGWPWPSWETAERFDFAHHIREVAAGAGNTITALLDHPMPPHLPPWQLVLQAPAAGGFSLIFITHHCLLDGVSVRRLLCDLLGPDPCTSSPAIHREDSNVVRRLGVKATLRSLLTMFAVPSARSLFETRDRGSRHLCTAEISLGALRAAARRVLPAKATVNDVYLAAVAGALREVGLRQAAPPNPRLRAVVPVDLRDISNADMLGNHVGFITVEMPVTVADPVERLRAIVRVTTHAKQAQHAVATWQFSRWLGWSSYLGTRLLSWFGTSRWCYAVVCSNVFSLPEGLRVGQAQATGCTGMTLHLRGLSLMLTGVCDDLRVSILIETTKAMFGEQFARLLAEEVQRLARPDGSRDALRDD